MNLPDFKLPIEDKNAAYFWLREWDDRFRETKDHAFKEMADAMRLYITHNFESEEEL